MKTFKQHLRQQIALEQAFPLDDELNEGRLRDFARKVGIGALSTALIASPVMRPAGQSVEMGKPTAARQVEKGGVSVRDVSTSGPAQKVTIPGHKHQTSYEITGQKDPKTGGPILDKEGKIKPGADTMTIKDRDLAGQRAVPGSVTAQKVAADKAKDTAPRTETRPGSVTPKISINMKSGSTERTRAGTVTPKFDLSVVPNLSDRDIERNVPVQTGAIGVRRRRGETPSGGGATSTSGRTSTGGASTGGGSSRTFPPLDGGVVPRIPSLPPKPTPSGKVTVPVSPQGKRRLQRVGGRLVTQRPGSVTVPSTSKAGAQGVLRTMREEKDAKGQMHFDFEGAKAARVERERAEKADDAAFDKATLYNREYPKSPINARAMIKLRNKKS